MHSLFPQNPLGMEITKAHGHETTKKINALYNESLNNTPGMTKGGSTAINEARMTTTGCSTLQIL